jgi:protein KRI1
LNRPIQSEIAEVKEYKTKKNAIELKKKVLHSLFEEEDEEKVEKDKDVKPNNNESENNKKKKDVSKKDIEIKKDSEIIIQSKEEPVIEKTENKVNKKADKAQLKNGKVSKKKKNKNVMESLTDERLKAYGIDPKKFKKKIKYSKNNNKNVEKIDS